MMKRSLHNSRGVTGSSPVHASNSLNQLLMKLLLLGALFALLASCSSSTSPPDQNHGTNGGFAWSGNWIGKRDTITLGVNGASKYMRIVGVTSDTVQQQAADKFIARFYGDNSYCTLLCYPDSIRVYWTSAGDVSGKLYRPQ